MATFKVGQKVRVVGVEDARYAGARAVGHEGEIAGVTSHHDDRAYCWIVNVPDCPNDVGGSLPPTHYFFRSCDLAPLTDPKADEFIESLKKLAREPQPARPLVVHN